MYILHTYNHTYLYDIHRYTVPKSINCNQVWFFCSLDSQQIQSRSAGHGLQIPSRAQCTMLRSGLSWFDMFETLSTSLASTWLNGFFGKLYKSNPWTSQNTNKMDVRRLKCVPVRLSLFLFAVPKQMCPLIVVDLSALGDALTLYLLCIMTVLVKACSWSWRILILLLLLLEEEEEEGEEETPHHHHHHHHHQTLSYSSSFVIFIKNSWGKRKKTNLGGGGKRKLGWHVML